jgi:DNA repair protein RecO (recombination protein O)
VTVTYLGALLAGDWPSTRGIPAPTLRQGSGMVAAFIGWHLDHGLRSLSHVDRPRTAD